MPFALLTFEVRESSPAFKEKANTLRTAIEKRLVDSMGWERTNPPIHTTYVKALTSVQDQAVLLRAAVVASRREKEVTEAAATVSFALLVGENSPATGPL